MCQLNFFNNKMGFSASGFIHFKLLHNILFICPFNQQKYQALFLFLGHTSEQDIQKSVFTELNSNRKK